MSQNDTQNNQEEDVAPENPQKIVTVTGPGEKTWDIPIENDEVLFDQTLHAGFYELTISDKPAGENEDQPPDENEETETPKQLWAVNLASETESHIGIVDGIEDLLAESEVLVGSSFFRYPPWIYLVFLAVILTVVEWFLYQRRRID